MYGCETSSGPRTSAALASAIGVSAMTDQEHWEGVSLKSKIIFWILYSLTCIVLGGAAVYGWFHGMGALR